MKIKELHSWNEFGGAVDELQQRHQIDKTDWPEEVHTPDLVFRGQSDAGLNLETTLERAIAGKQKLIDYYSLIQKARSRIETFADKHWDKFPNDTEFQEWLKAKDSTRLSYSPELLEYMIYLRHYGFPSPLLDWSRSPYIAAYFAFRDYRSTAKSVAIFAYRSYVGAKIFKSYGPGNRLAKPNITLIEADIRSDQRHFLQQSRYTVCTEGVGSELSYCSHEVVVEDQNLIKDVLQQDLLLKIIVPASERRKALRELESYNINAYSLFPSEESLMETVFLREHLIPSK